MTQAREDTSEPYPLALRHLTSNPTVSFVPSAFRVSADERHGP